MNKFGFAGFSVVVALVVAGCAPQTPAPVVGGYGQRSGVVTVAQPDVVASNAATEAASPQSVSVMKVQMVKESQDQIAKNMAQGEKTALSEISPAAGNVDAAPAEDAAPATVSHKVVASDTVYKLARTYNTTSGQILKDNGLASTTDIKEGMVLTIASNSKPKSTAWDDMRKMLSPTPMAGTTTDVAQKVEPSVVKPMPVDAEKAIATTVDTKNLAAIEPAAGERPVKADDSVDFVKYTVQPKETIYRISLKYNVSVLDIMAANDFDQPQDLKANAIIRVPVKKTITAQLASKNAAVAPAEGDDSSKAPVVVESADKPVQVAMLSTAPAGAAEAKHEDFETKAIKQQAMKDATLAPQKEKPLTKDEEAKAEEIRGHIDAAAARSKGLVWPVKGQIVKRFGDDGNGVARTGINIAVPNGTPVLASEGGTVLYADDGLKIYGKMVLVRHDNGMVSAYAHNSYLLVKRNERVKKGQVIALSGSSGNVESPQLHFELRQHASAIDPMRMLPSL